MLFLLFTISVISMALLVMYQKDKHTLKRMIEGVTIVCQRLKFMFDEMARGRCGLPGLPNASFESEFKNKEEGGDSTAVVSQDPFDSQLITLAQVLDEKRKQILDSKVRVDNAESVLKNLHVSSLAIRNRYQSIMQDLKDELEAAEEECIDLNKSIGKANMLKSKFFSDDNDDECDKETEVPPAPTKPPSSICSNKSDGGRRSIGGGAGTGSGGGGSCRVCSSRSGGLGTGIAGGGRVCRSGSTSKSTEPSADCHPPINTPSTFSTCKCPNPVRTSPLSTCISPRPSCGLSLSTGSRPQSRSGGPAGCSTLPPRPPLLKMSCSQKKSGSETPACSLQSSKTNTSCCSTYSSPPSPKYSQSIPCPPPLPSLVPPSRTPSQSVNNQNPLPGAGGCCQPRNKPSGCTDNLCPQARACPPQGPDPPDSGCPTSKFVRRPPFSTFLGERMGPSPIQRRSIKQTKQTIVTECIEGEEDESGSWLEPTIVQTEVCTSSEVTFPPNCCVSAYEEFLSGLATPPPVDPKTLPIFYDGCDPCAEIPREISPFEDIENTTHTCGTQTIEEEEYTESTTELIRQICSNYDEK